MVNDTISDILTRIRNANLIKSQTVSIPLTRISKQISEILEKQGFIESFQISSPSLNQHVKNLSPLELSQEKTSIIDKIPADKIKKNSLDTTSQKLGSSRFASKKNSSAEHSEHQSATQTGIILYLKYQGRDKKPCITNLKRISKPGLRIYANYKEIPKVLGGMGVAILSTSKGIMTDREARFHKIGGEILCSIW